MEGATLTPTLTLTLALISAAALVLGPVLVALINRSGPRSRSALEQLDPDKVMPRAEYDALVDQLARLDDENDRLARENTRLREEQIARRIEDDRLYGKDRTL